MQRIHELAKIVQSLYPDTIPDDYNVTYMKDIQWNLRQQTPSITETSTMRTRGRGPKSFPIAYCT